VVGDRAQVGAKSGVGGPVPEGARVAGIPAVPIKEWLRNVRQQRRRVGKPARGKKGTRA